MQPATNSHIKRRIYFIIFSVLFLIMIPVVLLYATGYRLTSHFQLVSTGGISLTDVSSDMQVYINYQPQRSSAFFDSQFVVKDLLPGDYFVVVAKDGYWSWAKHITVVQKEVTSAATLLVPEHPELRLITQFVPEQSLIGAFDFFASSSGATNQPNPEYADVAALFAQKFISPNALSPRVNGDASLWLAGPSHENITIAWNGDIADAPSFFCSATTTPLAPTLAQAAAQDVQDDSGAGVGSGTIASTTSNMIPQCQSTFVDYQSAFPVKNAAFFPDRDDVVVLELENGLYALELDRAPQQNYQPIYLSPNDINFRVSLDGKLYVEENNSFYQVEI